MKEDEIIVSQCPLCRAKCKLNVALEEIDTLYQQKLYKAYPRDFCTRRIEMIKHGIMLDNRIGFCFDIGPESEEQVSKECSEQINLKITLGRWPSEMFDMLLDSVTV